MNSFREIAEANSKYTVTVGTPNGRESFDISNKLPERLAGIIDTGKESEFLKILKSKDSNRFKKLNNLLDLSVYLKELDGLNEDINDSITEAKFKTVAVEKYEVIIRVGFKELIVEVDLPGSTGRWTMNGDNVRKIQDTFECNLKTTYWSKKATMISSIEKATKADEVEVNRIK